MDTLIALLIIAGAFLTYRYSKGPTLKRINKLDNSEIKNKQLRNRPKRKKTGIILIILGFLFSSLFNNPSDNSTNPLNSKKMVLNSQTNKKDRKKEKDSTNQHKTNKNKSNKKGLSKKSKSKSSSSSELKVAKNEINTPQQQQTPPASQSSSYVPKPKAPVGQWVDIQQVRDGEIPDGYVVITPNGRKYHNSAYDSSLSRTRTVMVITRESAEGQGYTLAQR